MIDPVPEEETALMLRFQDRVRRGVARRGAFPFLVVATAHTRAQRRDPRARDAAR